MGGLIVAQDPARVHAHACLQLLLLPGPFILHFARGPMRQLCHLQVLAGHGGEEWLLL